jgi:hypothetical protein
MKRLLVYVKFSGEPVENLIAEGVEFNNENIALHELLTTTILVLDNTESIYKHYKVLGRVRIKWIDFDDLGKNIH